MAFDKTFVSNIVITKQDLAQLSISEDLSDLEKWEAAFKKFETDEQEIQKFIKRYKQLNYTEWSKESKIAELFCGKGNSLLALEQLGFSNLIGIDLSENLLKQYKGSAKTIVANCLDLQVIQNQSFDIVFIQGGVHHLPNLEYSLPILFSEIKRVLKPKGVFIMIEPWLTPYLQIVHILSSLRLIRKWSKPFCAFSKWSFSNVKRILTGLKVTF